VSVICACRIPTPLEVSWPMQEMTCLFALAVHWRETELGAGVTVMSGQSARVGEWSGSPL